MKKQYVFILSSLALVAGGLLIYFAPDLSSYFFSQTPSFKPQTPLITKEFSFSSQVLIRHKGQKDFFPLQTTDGIYHLDTLMIPSKASLEIAFKSGYRVQILSESKIILEYWDEEDPGSPVYIHFVQGDYRTLKTGIVGQLYV
ncbi:MAG: hypothetical protein D6797_08780, partial [Bdellovibrio sp.]